MNPPSSERAGTRFLGTGATPRGAKETSSFLVHKLPLKSLVDERENVHIRFMRSRLTIDRWGEKTKTEGEQLSSPSVSFWKVTLLASEFSTDRSDSYCMNAVLFPGSLCFQLIDAHVLR